MRPTQLLVTILPQTYVCTKSSLCDASKSMHITEHLKKTDTSSGRTGRLLGQDPEPPWPPAQMRLSLLIQLTPNPVSLSPTPSVRSHVPVHV